LDQLTAIKNKLEKYKAIIIWVVYVVLVWGSGNDWKSSGFGIITFLPFFVPVFIGSYYLFGRGAGLLSNALKLNKKWLLALAIILYGIIPRTWTLKFWEEDYNVVYVMFHLISLGHCLLLGFIAYAFSVASQSTDTKRPFYALFLICFSLAVTESMVVTNTISTTGTYILNYSKWEDWKDGKNVPEDYRTSLDNGVRYIVVDTFLDNSHGYYYVFKDGVSPKDSALTGTILETRDLPNGWVEYLANH